MSNFQIKTSLDLIRERDPIWIDVPISRSVDESGRPVGVDYAGTRYRLIIRERHFSCLERTGRGLLGVIAVIFTLGLVLLFDHHLGENDIKELFQKKITRHFGIRDELIPVRWHQDLILQKFLCAMTGIPIWGPVADPYVSTELYDQFAIIPWVVEHRTSPVTALPIAPYQINLTGKQIIKGLIHYRIQQLKLCENQLGCELNNRDESHKKLMKDSALELNRQITLLLKKPPEETVKEMEEIPPFLDGAGGFWSYRCAKTGKPVFKNLVPQLGDASLVDIRRQIIVALNELRQYYKPITP